LSNYDGLPGLKAIYVPNRKLGHGPKGSYKGRGITRRGQQYPLYHLKPVQYQGKGTLWKRILCKGRDGTENQFAPPEISTPEQFVSFNESEYVKVAVNFCFINTNNKETILTTEACNKKHFGILSK
jgi:hypothetical protein